MIRLARRAAAAALVALAACSGAPIIDHEDARPPDPIDAPDVPADAIEPPGSAMETLSGAGHVTSGDLSFDIVIGGAPRGRTAEGAHTLEAAPVLR